MATISPDMASVLVDGAFRRSVALLTPEAPLQEILDLAELALASDERDSALLLFGVAALERGLSPEALRWQAGLARRTGLWRAPELPTADGVTTSMVERGLAELRDLLASAPRLHVPDKVADTGSAHNFLPADRFATLGRDLGQELHRMLEAGGEADLPAVSRVLADAGRWDLSHEHRRLDGDLATLAAAVAFDRIRRLALKLNELAALGWGNPLSRIIGLSLTGLGPFLSNVIRLVRDGRDLPALLRVAPDEPLDGAEEPAWLIALTITAPAYTAPHIARAVRLRGGADALGLLTQRARDIPTRNWAWAVRDVALEAGDGAIAAGAQRRLTDLAPGDWAEWIILGDLLGLIGQAASARDAFTRCQAIRPEPQVTARIRALDARSFSLATCSTGFFGDPLRAQVTARLLASR